MLIFGTIYSFSSNKVAVYLWLGTLLYLVYTFLIYCFTVRFNALFIPYCLILGFSFFSLVWFFSGDTSKFYGSISNRILVITGIYFIAISILFYTLWLSELLPATIRNEVPDDVRVAGLMTNPVRVIDLSLFLPATFIIGMKSLRKSRISTILSPVFLTFFILMDLTIAALSIIMKMRGVGGNEAVAIIMIVLAVVSLILLIRLLRGSETTHPG